MKKYIIVIWVLLGLLSVPVYSSSITEVQNRITNIKAPTPITVPNAPNPSYDQKGFVGEVIARIFNSDWRIESDFIQAFSTILLSANNIPRWNGSSFQPWIMTDTWGVNAKIGIGTSSPEVQFHTVSTARFDGGVQVDGIRAIHHTNRSHNAQFTNDSSYGMFELRNGSANRGAYFGAGNGWDRVDLVLEDASKLSIRWGNVGIGTTDPVSALHVSWNVIASSPTTANHLTTKDYVDNLVAASTSLPTCSNGQILKHNGLEFVCSNDTWGFSTNASWWGASQVITDMCFRPTGTSNPDCSSCVGWISAWWEKLGHWDVDSSWGRWKTSLDIPSFTNEGNGSYMWAICVKRESVTYGSSLSSNWGGSTIAITDVSVVKTVESGDYATATCPSDTIRLWCSGAREESLNDTCDEESCWYFWALPVGDKSCRVWIDGDSGTEAVAIAYCGTWAPTSSWGWTDTDWIESSTAVYNTVKNIGVGKTNPTEKLEVQWNVKVSGSIKASSFIYNSDLRLKDAVITTDGLNTILQLRGVDFTWKKDGTQDTGFIAQEVEGVLPHIVHTDPSTGLKSVEYWNVIAPLVEAIKEQQVQIESLQGQINMLKK